MPPERFRRPVPIPVKGAPIEPCCEAVPESPEPIAHSIASDILKGWAERGRCGGSDVPDPEETEPRILLPGSAQRSRMLGQFGLKRGFDRRAGLRVSGGSIRGVSRGYGRPMDLDATGRLAAEVDPTSRSNAERVPHGAGADPFGQVVAAV